MRFYNYLNESRSKEYSKDKIVEVLEKYCTQAIESYKKNDSLILRATNTSGEFLLTNPKKEKPRKSAYSVGNYYTLWMNNNELWDKFPKREIICASGRRAIQHGADNLFYVFPFNNAKIGICPTDDIWGSFKDLEEMNMDANMLNYFLNELLGESAEPEDWKEIKQAMKKLTPNNVDTLGLDMPGSAYNLLNSWLNSGDNLYSYLTDLLDPKHNNFDLQKISKYTYGMDSNREVWTDSPCVLLYYESLDTKSIMRDFEII